MWLHPPLHFTHISLALSQNSSTSCKICCGNHKRSNNTSSLQHCEFSLLQFLLTIQFTCLIRSLYSNNQRKVEDTEASIPPIPQSSMPALGVPSFGGSASHKMHPHPPDVAHVPMSAPKLPRPAPTRRAAKRSEPSTAIDDRILQDFYNAAPFSIKAEDLIHAIMEGESDLFKIPRRRQINLLYKVFQHCWVRSLREFYHWVVRFMHSLIQLLYQNLSIKERRHQSLDSM